MTLNVVPTIPFKLVGEAHQGPDNNFYGCVVKIYPDGDMKVLTVGVEANAEDIRAWLEGTIKLIRDTGNEEAELPDMFDRKGMH